MRISNQRRKAISPVLATVILIAITLIAAVAIAGFVFGLFGTFTSSAQVSAQVQSCTHTGGNDVCTVVLTNTGTSNVSALTCSVNIAGAATPGAVAGTPLAVQASNHVTATCTVTAGAAQTVGSQAVGSFAMSNGASVPFSGVWS